MKTQLLHVIFLTLTFSATSQIYVDPAATGANTGSSWNDAYIDFQDALDDNSSAEVWLKAGVYKPGMNNGSLQFVVGSPKRIYGGFSGSESSVDDRDTDINITHFTGDINDDDQVLDLTANRIDNALHLLLIDSTAVQVTVDGILFTNGNTEMEDNDQADFLVRGGAIYARAEVEINDCDFEENVARSGGAVYIDRTTNSKVTNCNFTNNMSVSQGAGLLLNASESPTIEYNNFVSNNVVRGSLYLLRCSNSTVNECDFTFNNIINSEWGGAGMFHWNCINSMITNCEFNDNTGRNASGIYIDGREIEYALTATLTGCTFDSNTNTDYGGVLYAWTANYEMYNCDFTGNSGPNATCFYHGRTRYYVEDCTFITNTADFGAAGSNYNEGTEGSFVGCDFLFNESFTSGGACMVGFKGLANFEGCTFENNVANWGGAIYMQNDTSKASFSNCYFLNNQSQNFGGAINAFAAIELDILDSQFEGNTSDFGGALSFDLDTLTSMGYLNIERSDFRLNVANTQGGAINIGNSPTSIRSSLFALNAALGNGTGGAICNNAYDEKNSVLAITNSTFAHNEGELSAGIAQFEDETGKARVDLLNTILFNPGGLDYAIEAGEPNLVSLGGNLILQEGLEDVFNQELDDIGSDPLFESIVNRDFHLQTGSPAINTGLLEGSHDTDLDGNSIIEDPDKGCYDRGVSSIKNILQEDFFAILGNPTNEILHLEFSQSVEGKVRIYLLNQEGKLAISHRAENTFDGQHIKMDVSNLSSGSYFVLVYTPKGSLQKPVIIH